uniref:TilS substrate-binding domain-containing protein n=1 Tax=Sporichthya sp. TaxID=65475 RepID=UPI0017C4F8C8
GLHCAALAAVPEAIRTRILRSAAIAAGCPAGALSAGHVESLAALVLAWRGQQGVDLPGQVRASRVCGTLLFAARHEESAP